jgi:glycosyltransferase involved in cell wall biosynthesis
MPTSTIMKIIGILLVKDEDLYVERVLRNAIDFCDKVIAVEGPSSDRTLEILEELKTEFGDKVEIHSVMTPSVSHDLIQDYAGTHAWVFGFDGDEIYDPEGLARMRKRLKAGEFDKDWCIFGSVLNVRRINVGEGWAQGHLAPPCRSMTKLYNFNAIEAWHGPCRERMHGGTIIFRDGYHEGLRRNLHEHVAWENADFRCIHPCFVRRSSRDAENPRNRDCIMDRHTWSILRFIRGWIAFFLRGAPRDSKEQRYGRGPLVTKEVGSFFDAIKEP